MPILYQPERVLTEDFRTYLIANENTDFLLPCEEGNVEIKGNWLLINLIIAMPLIKRYRPISRDKHLLLTGIYTSKEHAKVLTKISRTLEDLGYTREALSEDMILTVNDMHNLCITHLGDYIRTMDIFGIADTILQENIKDLSTPDYGNIEMNNIAQMETMFKTRSQEVVSLLRSDTLAINVFRAPLLCGALKEDQFAQFVHSAGPKTDTDDRMFRRPVVGSYLSGFYDIMDLSIESRAAAKAAYYNANQMASAQYNNRKTHIQTSAVNHLYLGDCGSDAYMTYEINPVTVHNFLGKFYLNASGELVELTRERFKDVVGTIIKIRDVPTCRYTDGYCEMCGGTITRSFSRTGNVGFMANVNVGAPFAQKVLSTKHLTATTVIPYRVPEALSIVFLSISHQIFLTDQAIGKMGSLCFGFKIKDVAKVNDLRNCAPEHVDEMITHFSNITSLYIGEMKENGTIVKLSNQISDLQGGDKTYPHLSPEVLNVMRAHPEDLSVEGQTVWFRIRHTDPMKPFMECSVVNSSIRHAVEKFQKALATDVSRFKSLNDFMTEMTRLIWDEGKVDAHVTHIACLAKACLITNHHNFSIPQVQDPDHVMFGTLGRIIPARSIGALFAYERFSVAANRPLTYVVPKQHQFFDEFMGYSDLIDANMHWPEGYDRLLHEPL